MKRPTGSLPGLGSFSYLFIVKISKSLFLEKFQPRISSLSVSENSQQLVSGLVLDHVMLTATTKGFEKLHRLEN